MPAWTTIGRRMGPSSLSLLVIMGMQSSLLGEDWPEWRGPNRDGISTEKSWIAQWPPEGPKRLWEAKVGVGYSSCSVSQGRLYTMGNIDDVDHVFCLNAETGKLIWEHTYPCSAKDRNGYHGTRVTPTVDGNRVYTVSRHGHLFCLDAAKGTVIWSKDFKKDFGATPPRWGFSGSPLIEKNWMLIEVGGKGQSVVAFDKANGTIIWKNGDDDVAYSSLVAFDHAGQRCLAVFCKDNIVGRSMKDGSELWRSYWKTSYGVNAATPIIDGNKVFISSGYNAGCSLLELTGSGVQEVWRNKDMRNHVNSCVLWDGYLYGFDESELKCMDMKTGEVMWNTKRFGKGSLMLANEKLILYSDRGLLAVAAVNPKEYQEISSVQVLGGKSTWAMPVLANGRIYCRSLEDLVALDVKGQ